MQALSQARTESPSDGQELGASIATLAAAYRAGTRDPMADLSATFDRLQALGDNPVWIALASRQSALTTLADAVARLRSGASLPLFGIPFAVKDNIDVAGLPTTAGCPEFAYQPAHSAAVVERLVAAGAIPIGKTNLDQFATGLNGTRSPYGVPTSVFDAERVSGGSSSGSAVAVAAGLVPFALGTDTAGSGRVPAGFNNIVGLKPTKGLVSTRGLVPACRTQDCVSIFARNVGDALAVTRAASGFDQTDPFSRQAPASTLVAREFPSGFRYGVLSEAELAGDHPEVARLYQGAAARLQALGGVPVPLNFAPFAAAARLLYDGPWVAERLAGIKGFAASHPERIHPVVREIVLGGGRWSAVEAFEGQYRLADYVRTVSSQWAAMELMLLPTAPSHPTIAEMLADPVGCNAGLGRYTNFVNLMDLAAIALPAGLDTAGLPVGVQLIGPAFSDGALALVADRLHRACEGAMLGATDTPLHAVPPMVPERDPDRVDIAVVGAHLTGEPLNPDLLLAGGRLVRTASTAPGYSLYLLPGTAPSKPGLVRDGGAGGVELEIWDLPVAGFGAFVAAIPSPLGIGTVELADGSAVKGFLCEARAVAAARDITGFGGWRAYLAASGAKAA